MRRGAVLLLSVPHHGERYALREDYTALRVRLLEIAAASAMDVDWPSCPACLTICEGYSHHSLFAL